MRAAARVALIALIAFAGCDLPPEGADEGGPVVLASDPANGEDGVDRFRVFRVFFDRPLYPRDVHRGNVLVESGVRGVFLWPRFDPALRELWIEPGGPLDPSVRYRLRVEVVRDLDRREMAEPFVATFTTGDIASGPERPAPARWEDVAPIFARCAEAGCHGGDAPVLGLDLSSAEAVRRTAIGVPAEQSRVGVQGDEPWVADTLAGLARVDVSAGIGRPSRSYLLYKVLGDPHVGGARMPPPPAAPLSVADAARLSRWILSGAPTD